MFRCFRVLSNVTFCMTTLYPYCCIRALQRLPIVWNRDDEFITLQWHFLMFEQINVERLIYVYQVLQRRCVVCLRVFYLVLHIFYMLVLDHSPLSMHY